MCSSDLRSNYVCRQRVTELEATDSGQGTLEIEEFGASLRGEIDRLLAWSRRTPTGDRAELDWAPSERAWQAVTVGSDECPGGSRCPQGGVCFSETARHAAAEADVIVVNLHLYGLDVAASGAIFPEHDVVVVDEAHQLEDVMSDTVGVQITGGRFTGLAAALRRILDDPAVVAPIAEAPQAVRDTLGPLLNQRLTVPLPTEVNDLLLDLRNRTQAALTALRAIDTTVDEARQRVLRGQQLATRALLNMVDAYRRGEALSLDGDVIDILRRALAQADADPAFAAEVLALPGEMFLGDQMAEVDVEAIHTARQAARAQVGHALNAELALMYERLTDTGPYRIDGASIGRRALRNACLSYLAAAGSESAVERLDKQFHAAGNMTDVLAALTNLVEFERPERDKALAKFYEDWSQDDLVVDKWFGVQAMSSLPGTLDRVKALTRHKAFDFKNPNRLRALVAAFAHANQVRFHDAGGAGYAFLADQIIALDPFSATVARSEEHTSELQSLAYHVCRLLLEK